MESEGGGYTRRPEGTARWAAGARKLCHALRLTDNPPAPPPRHRPPIPDTRPPSPTTLPLTSSSISCSMRRSGAVIVS